MSMTEMKKKSEPWKHAPRSAETRAKISASMRGKNRGNANAKKPARERRVVVSASVAPATLSALRGIRRRSGKSIGKIIDEAVAALVLKV